MSLYGVTTTETVTGGVTLELSSYDMQRQVHPAVKDPSMMITIGARTLSTELQCPICLDLLNNTMTTKECLHRFCHDCISMSLQRLNRECPTCRKKLVSKRSLRKDEHMDNLIRTLYGDRTVYENMQQSSLNKIQVRTSFEALSKSIKAGIEAQAASRRQRIQGSYDIDRRRKRQNMPGRSTDFDEEMDEVSNDDLSEVASPIDDREQRERIYDFHSEEEEEDDAESVTSSDVSTDSSVMTFVPSDVDTDDDTRELHQKSTQAAAKIAQPNFVKLAKQHLEELLRPKTGIPSEQMDPVLIRPKNFDQRLPKGEIDIELAPAGNTKLSQFVVPQLGISQFIRVSAEARVSCLTRFIAHRAKALVAKTPPAHAAASSSAASSSVAGPSSSKVSIPRPKHFYISVRNGIRKLNLSDTLGSVYQISSGTTEHLVIFYSATALKVAPKQRLLAN